MCSLRPTPFSYLCVRVRILGRSLRGATLLSGEEVLPSEEGHRAARLRGVPRRHAERPWPSLVFQAGALEEDGVPVGRVRPGAERKADSKRQIFNRLSQRGPAGQVVTVPESARGCGHSVPHPGTHR